MGAFFLIAFLLGAQPAREFELEGRIVPEARASVHLHGATSPFSASTLTDSRGRFRFRKLLAGPYTISVFVPGRGEARRTIEIGPSLAGGNGRVPVVIELDEASFQVREALERRASVSARELAIPGRAVREYEQAQKKLARRDVAAAAAHLERAVELAPDYASAWNNLGTIAYQTQQYEKAERHFRRALEADPGAFEPLVNLGGVLVTLGKHAESLPYNLHAVLSRPHDALANSQLGMSYYFTGNLALAEKHLKAAKRLDPAHFSHPQLLLAEIHLRLGRPEAAAGELEEFLRHHPDWKDAGKLRQAITRLGSGSADPIR
jgi:Tfp pilus assembly protein PilF